jgi:hypothetical protein
MAVRSAVIDANSRVVNVIMADPAEDAVADHTLVASDTAAIGDHYDGTTFATPRVWLERLPADKQTAISQAALGNAAVLLLLLKAAGSATIDVSAAETVAGVNALVTAGVITSDDAAILLAP